MNQQVLDFSTYRKPVSLRDVFALAPAFSSKAAKFLRYVLIGCIVFGVAASLLIGLTVASVSTFAIMLMVLVVFPLIFLSLSALVIYKNAVRAVRLKRLAKTNGFDFSATRPTAGYPGLIFSIGRSPQYATVVSGTYHNLPFEFGNFFCTVGSGRSSRRLSFGVLDVKLTRKLPHILLDSRANNPFGFSNLPQFQNSQHLTLEGNFNQYFNLYVPDGYERDALYFITPELMALLIDLGAKFDIEIVDDHLYIYSNREFRLEQQTTVEQIFKLVSVLGREVQENTSRYADAHIGDRAANIVAEPGRRLKHAGPWIALAIVFIYLASVIWHLIQ